MPQPSNIPVYDIQNANGKAPLLIGCDHAENRIPEGLSDLGLEPAHLESHIALDVGAKQVSMLLSEMFDAPLIMAGYSRLVVDLNRYPHDPSLILDVSDGISIPGNMNLDAASRQERIDAFFDPYHRKYAEMARDMMERHDAPLLLALHSFSPTYEGQQRPWHYGVMWDEYPKNVKEQLLEGLNGVGGLVIGDNKPYAGHSPQGYAHVEHGHKNSMRVALLEIRHDLISKPADQERSAELLYEVFKNIVPA
ncbi:MAG: N-formylglutamate amidohydrolase [Gammaproteobacteria bacterium]|nr:N-formylglutamate amidohydrolase [Gammaproteobacteria bacterium]